MSTVVLFHHALGLTDGVRDLAATWRRAGHEVHTPDLFDGSVFATVAEGVAHARQIGFPAVLQRGAAAVDGLGADLVYAGISLGVLPAQMLAQTRPGARAAVLLEACVPPDEFGGPWSESVPLQVHGMADDPFFAGEGDLEVARAVAATVPSAEVVVHDGAVHLFTDSSLESYDAAATAAVNERVLALLASLDG